MSGVERGVWRAIALLTRIGSSTPMGSASPAGACGGQPPPS